MRQAGHNSPRLEGLEWSEPQNGKKAADIRGPVIMALADVGEFEDAKNLLAMGRMSSSLREQTPSSPNGSRVALLESIH